ncbi:MAG: hypothetical protein U9Q74_14845 [Gemmatimonadota bacterium]|nr:hypothetical protein [Gemmatimonadota bacterium]
MLRHVSAIAVVLAAGASVAPAQGTGCEDATARISVNALPRVGAPQWNDWVTLTGCGTRGATVIAGALQSDGIRRETELTRLDHLAGLLDGWFQPVLVNAYEGLLHAPDASYGMKLRAMWLLSGLYVPAVDVAGPLQGYMSARCESYQRTTSLRDAPATLPAEAYDRARDAVAFVADDRTAPEYVRSTAGCWEAVIRDGLAQGTTQVQAPPPVIAPDNQPVVVNATTVVVERPIRVAYECGTRFVFYNDIGYDLAVRYDGYGGGVLRVASGGPFVWAAARFGPVRFWVGDREVWYAAPVYRPCGSRLVYGPAIYPWYGWHAGLGVYLGSRVVAPRVVVVPRVTRPIVVVNRPRGGRDRDDWRNRDDWRDPRDGRRDNPRGGDDRGGRGGRQQDNCCGYYGPRGPGQPAPSVPVTAVPRNTSPVPRPPEDQRQRLAVPKGGGSSGGREASPAPGRSERAKPMRAPDGPAVKRP